MNIYTKANFYGIELAFDFAGKKQETGFLIQTRSSYNNWNPVTYVGVLVAGGWLAYLIASLEKHSGRKNKEGNDS